MTDQDFTTIYSITLEAPSRIKVMSSSTPTGRRGMFYKICTQMPFSLEEHLPPINTKKLGYVFDKSKYDVQLAEGWKEFYFPSMVNPEWDLKMERELRAQFSEVTFQHEVLAEFGTETVGVFNKDYVDEAASLNYPLQTARVSDGPIAFGIDWDGVLSPWSVSFSVKLSELLEAG